MQGVGTILREKSERNLIYDKSALSNYKFVKEGDFIVHLRSFEGGLEIANSDGIVSPAYHILHGDNIDTTFFYLYFHSNKFINVKLKKCVYGIRDGRSINIKEMLRLLLPYTNTIEQYNIGNLFRKLDNLLTFHQCQSFLYFS